MTVNRVVALLAGLMVLASIGLAQFVHPNWIWLGVFVGFNLAQSGITSFCPLSVALKKAGVPTEK